MLCALPRLIHLDRWSADRFEAPLFLALAGVVGSFCVGGPVVGVGWVGGVCDKL